MFSRFWCDWWAPTLFFSWDNLQIPFCHSILNRFWLTRFKMIYNAILHHIVKKNLWYFMKNQKFFVKRSFSSRILGKNTSLKRINFGSCKTRFPFFNDFQILHVGSNTIKELSKSLIFKNNLKFLKKLEFYAPSLQNLHLLSNFDEILCGKYSSFSWKLRIDEKKLRTRVPLSSPSPSKISYSSFIIFFLWKFVWNIPIWILV